MLLLFIPFCGSACWLLQMYVCSSVCLLMHKYTLKGRHRYMLVYIEKPFRLERTTHKAYCNLNSWLQFGFLFFLSTVFTSLWSLLFTKPQNKSQLTDNSASFLLQGTPRRELCELILPAIKQKCFISFSTQNIDLPYWDVLLKISSAFKIKEVAKPMICRVDK